jgi:hypothetical protein
MVELTNLPLQRISEFHMQIKVLRNLTDVMHNSVVRALSSPRKLNV